MNNDAIRRLKEPVAAVLAYHYGVCHPGELFNGKCRAEWIHTLNQEVLRMKCTRCGQAILQDEADRVVDCFDYQFEHPVCFECATEVWRDEEQSRTMNNPPQDEGDG
jgi:DNA-directed RNA polymerase subunit RPC12/RpoP